MNLDYVKANSVANEIIVGPDLGGGLPEGNFTLSPAEAAGILDYLSLRSPFTDGVEMSGGWVAGIQVNYSLRNGETIAIQLNQSLAIWRAFEIIQYDCKVNPGLREILIRMRRLNP